MSRPALHRLHLAELQKSGLTPETIKLAGVYSESDPERLQRLLNWEFPAKALGTCLVIPYPGLAGEPTGYYRIKPATPRVGKDGKPLKYEAPVGEPGRIYFPPRVREAAAEPPARPRILIVGGETKAMAADQAGVATIGLPGVWSWVKPGRNPNDPNAKRELHPNLAQIKWKDRPVVIAFDSDAAYKYLIRLSEWELAQTLIREGATVRVVRVPQRVGGPKVGVDDYLVLHGPESLGKLLGKAMPPFKPVRKFANFHEVENPEAESGFDHVPRSAADMAVELVGRAGPHPKVVAGSLVARGRDGGLVHLDGHSKLQAFIRETVEDGVVSGVTFDQRTDTVSPQVLEKYLLANCERFDRADALPHVPPLQNVLYLNPHPDTAGGGEFKTLKAFVDLFSPATPEDNRLLLAALLTPMWGGPPGKRPAFLFEAGEDDADAGRGVGKTTVAQKIAAVYGGAFDVRQDQSAERLYNRLLSPDAMSYRVLLLDNLKSNRLSSQDLESLVTCPRLNGHKLYAGQAAVPNYFTLFLTLNGASLSKDFAQRTIPVRFDRRKHRPGWDVDVDRFFAANRDALVADLARYLSQKKPATLSRFSRWQLWESEVLARCGNADQVRRMMDLIAERTGGMDADAEDADRVREQIRLVVARATHPDDREYGRFLFTSSAATAILEAAMNERMTAQSAAARLKSIGMPDLKKSPRKGKRLWIWTDPDGGEPREGVTPPTVDYDRPRQTWLVDGRETAVDRPPRYPQVATSATQVAIAPGTSRTQRFDASHHRRESCKAWTSVR